MKLVRCISERKTNPGQITVGKKYWIDESTVWTDPDGDEYAEIYLDEEKEHRIGNMLTSHFETLYRYLDYCCLENYVNTKTGFLLKDILNWCLKNPTHKLAEKVIFYIYDNELATKAKMEKEFVVRSAPLREFVEKGLEDEYVRYLGYSVSCIE